MCELGHTEKNSVRANVFRVTLQAGIVQYSRHVSKVPTRDIASQKKKPPGSGLSNLMIAYQAAINAGFDFRR